MSVCSGVYTPSLGWTELQRLGPPNGQSRLALPDNSPSQQPTAGFIDLRPSKGIELLIFATLTAATQRIKSFCDLNLFLTTVQFFHWENTLPFFPLFQWVSTTRIDPRQRFLGAQREDLPSLG